MSGPLAGCTVVELAGIGPGPFAAMVLGDLGAEVVRVDRPEAAASPGDRDKDLLLRSRRSVAVNLKDPRGAEIVLEMLDDADVLIEGFRPGVAERLGVGPEECRARNPRLVYGRMTGWGRDGPLATRAGHDINYIALSGALHPIGRAGEAPVPPLNLVGDNGGGGMVLAMGVLAALFERQTSGEGQVVDAAMVDGTALLTTQFHGFVARGRWDDRRGFNQCTGAHFYETYETAEGEHMAVGAQEPHFYEELLRGLGLDPGAVPGQWDRDSWPAMKKRFTAIFKERTRAEWTDHFADTNACVTPVLSFQEAPRHPHNQVRGTFVEHHGVTQPAPAPRFHRTAAGLKHRPPLPGEHTTEVLAALGRTADEITALREDGVIA